MPRGRPRTNPDSPSTTAPKAFTHDSSTRTGLPAGGTAGKAPVPKAPKKKYWYNPHLSPVLRHDASGKREAEAKGYFEVDPVALSIHERVSPQAILRAARENYASLLSSKEADTCNSTSA